MLIIGCDYHPGFQQIAYVDTETGELQERRLKHPEEAEKFYRDLWEQRITVRVGMEASGNQTNFDLLQHRETNEQKGPVKRMPPTSSAKVTALIRPSCSPLSPALPPSSTRTVVRKMGMRFTAIARHTIAAKHMAKAYAGLSAGFFMLSLKEAGKATGDRSPCS